LQGKRRARILIHQNNFFWDGANAVRAYPQGKASGDEGWMANLECGIAAQKLGRM
jgi:hemolysin activation/secretion protein